VVLRRHARREYEEYMVCERRGGFGGHGERGGWRKENDGARVSKGEYQRCVECGGGGEEIGKE